MPDGPVRTVLRHFGQFLRLRQAGELTDEQLLSRFVAQADDEAFPQLVQRHGPMVLGVCQRILGEPHDVEDAFQATFLVLIRKAGSLRKPALVGNWLYGVACRVAQKARVAAARRRTHERTVAAMPADVSPDAAAWRELRPVLDQELERLPEKYRAPVVLCYLEGKTNEEAAQDLGWTKGTVSGRLARARELLRTRLEGRGAALAGGLLAVLLPQQAVAAVPMSLRDPILEAARRCAAGNTATAAVSTQATALADGELKAMRMTRMRMAVVTVLVLGVIGTGAAALVFHSETSARPAGEDRAPGNLEVKGKTDPPGLPLELRLIAKKDTYQLDLGGKTEKELRTLINDAKAINWDRATLADSAKWDRLPSAASVDLEAELHNRGDKELKVWIVGSKVAANADATGLLLEIKGPGAASCRRTLSVNTIIRPPANPLVLPPGKSHAFPIKNLASNAASIGGSYVYEVAYWTQPGNYTATATVHFAIAPSPPGVKPGEGDFGAVTVTSAPISLKIVGK